MPPLIIKILGCESVKVTEFEVILVSTNNWTQAASLSRLVKSAVECGIRCSNSKDCLEFRFLDGVCEVSGSWIPETTEEPSVTVFREKLGQQFLYCCQAQPQPQVQLS